MKHIFLIPIILMAYFVLISGTCNKSSDIILNKGASEMRKIDGINYTLTVTDIKDSRCPKDVKCIRAGEAFVSASFHTEKSSQQLLQFCTGIDCKRSSIGESVTVPTPSGSVEIKLVSVSSYPVQGGTAAAKTATFMVKKL